MTVLLSATAHAPLARRSVAQLQRIEHALNCFPRQFKSAVCLVARRDPSLADLALSFPALLFVIAVPHKGIDAMALERVVLAGMPLKALAKMAGLPFWLRKLPSHGFSNVIGPLPENSFISTQMAHHVPKRLRDAEHWLRDVSVATRWGTEGFALWVAQRPLSERLGLNPNSLCRLAMWAWFSQSPETAGFTLCKTPWHNKLNMKGSVKRANDWIAKVNLHLCLQSAQSQPRLEAMRNAGFDFVHLATAELIAEEANRMGNCIMGYGHDISQEGTELWSIRKDGASVATLSIDRDYDDGLAKISQIKGANNNLVARDVALAARRWFQSHDIEAISPVPPKHMVDGRIKAWQALFKPYWLAKKAVPRWMSFSPEDCCMRNIHTVQRRRRPR